MMPKNGSAMMYTSGCPKNQNRCCHSSAPPLAASNTTEPKRRSASSTSRDAARTGNAIRIRIDVNRVFHTKIGIRNIVMPGARIPMMVVMKLTAPRIVPKPASARPMIHRSGPMPGERSRLLRGA